MGFDTIVAGGGAPLDMGDGGAARTALNILGVAFINIQENGFPTDGPVEGGLQLETQLGELVLHGVQIEANIGERPDGIQNRDAVAGGVIVDGDGTFKAATLYLNGHVFDNDGQIDLYNGLGTGSQPQIRDVFGASLIALLDDVYDIGATDLADTIQTGPGEGVAYGRGGADAIWGGAGADYLYGQNGADQLVGRGSSDELRGGQGEDILWGGEAEDFLYGGPRRDTLSGGKDDDFLKGGAGDDIFFGGQGDDDIFGDGGEDVAVYQGSFAADAVSWKGGWQIRRDGVDDLQGVEAVRFDGGAELPLTRWRMDVKRWEDGKAQVKLWEFGPDGDKTLLYKAGGRRSADAHFDDATPVAKGLYHGMLRLNASNGRVIELMDPDTGASTVDGRTHIQVHGGFNTSNSDGCVVLKFRTLAFTPIYEALENTPTRTIIDRDGAPLKVWDTPEKMFSVRFTNGVDQPTLKARAKNGGEGASTVTFRVKDDGKDGITKLIELSYKMSSWAKVKAGDGIETGSLVQKGREISFRIDHDETAAQLHVSGRNKKAIKFDFVDADFWGQGKSAPQSQTRKQMVDLLLDDKEKNAEFTVDLWD